MFNLICQEINNCYNIALIYKEKGSLQYSVIGYATISDLYAIESEFESCHFIGQLTSFNTAQNTNNNIKLLFFVSLLSFCKNKFTLTLSELVYKSINDPLFINLLFNDEKIINSVVNNKEIGFSLQPDSVFFNLFNVNYDSSEYLNLFSDLTYALYTNEKNIIFPLKNDKLNCIENEFNYYSQF